MALVQEMAVKVDQGFLGATLGLFSPPTDLQTSRKKVRGRLKVQRRCCLRGRLMRCVCVCFSAG